MRIIGEIPHPEYKISILKMNEKVTVQIEDRLLTQSYIFRDGTGVKDTDSVKKFLTEKFMAGVDNRFEQMRAAYLEGIEELHKEDLDNFEII